MTTTRIPTMVIWGSFGVSSNSGKLGGGGSGFRDSQALLDLVGFLAVRAGLLALALDALADVV